MPEPVERSLSLYEHLDLLDLAAESLESPEANEALALTIQNEIAARTADKVEGIHRLLVSLDMTDTAVDEEIERLRAKKASNESIRNRVKDSVKRAMEAHGIKKISGRTVSMTLRTANPAVVIDDEDAVPMAYKRATVKMPAAMWQAITETVQDICPAWMRTEITQVQKSGGVQFAVSKTDVKKALDSGAEVPGADMSFGSTSLLIK